MVTTPKRRTKPPKGRPRAFDADRALDKAMHVFWRQGYEGTSLPDLTQAMGINRPSLYAAFGNKRALFRKAVNRYREEEAGYVREALSAPTARAAIERLLLGAANLLSDPRHPRGCLFVQGALACGRENEAIRQELNARRAAGETAIRKRLEQARTEGDLPSKSNPTDLARFFAAVNFGMAVQAAGGADRNELRKIAETALLALPPAL